MIDVPGFVPAEVDLDLVAASLAHQPGRHLRLAAVRTQTNSASGTSDMAAPCLG